MRELIDLVLWVLVGVASMAAIYLFICLMLAM
jgi:hypothetical protein